MIHIENVEVIGWEAALRGMRNPMNSWDKADSNFSCEECNGCIWEKDTRAKVEETEDGRDTTYWCSHSACRIGDNDMKLMKSLAKGGGVHAKYRRMIMVTCDITAPLYWWKEYDTYKVGTVANSCSTMHKIHAKEFELDDFSHEHLSIGEYGNVELLKAIITCLNVAREEFLETKDKATWWQMIQLLPTSYNQRRTVQFSYENAAAMHKDRHNHKLDEWHDFCNMLESLPYAEGIVYNIGGQT